MKKQLTKQQMLQKIVLLQKKVPQTELMSSKQMKFLQTMWLKPVTQIQTKSMKLRMVLQTALRKSKMPRTVLSSSFPTDSLMPDPPQAFPPVSLIPSLCDSRLRTSHLKQPCFHSYSV